MFKKYGLILFISCLYSCFSSAQSQGGSTVPDNMGLSFNILGLFFGQYELGATSYISPDIQVGLNMAYYSTQNISPQVDGWTAEFRVNYYFTTWRQNGFFIGVAPGFESVQTRKNSTSRWITYSDFTWALIPSYNWILGSTMSALFGLRYGYSFGEMQFTPEASFVVLL